jgi:hypothetical protein
MNPEDEGCRSDIGSTTISSDGGMAISNTRVEQPGSDRAGTVSDMTPHSLRALGTQWLLVGGPGDGSKCWHDAGLDIASLPDPNDPVRVHYYVGRQIEVDGATYQLGIHADVFDDVDLIALIRSSGLQPCHSRST